MSIQILVGKSQGKKLRDNFISKCIAENQGMECVTGLR